jgi:DNA-binding XRE family transcriptional regulator
MASSSSMADSNSSLRQVRMRLRMSQAECAAALGVAVETFRTWDAGRRPAPQAVVERAQSLKAKRPTQERVPLQILADELRVHVPLKMPYVLRPLMFEWFLDTLRADDFRPGLAGRIVRKLASVARRTAA